MKIKFAANLSAIALALCLGGCAGVDSVVFFTKTGTNVFDIDTSPGTIGIGYDRVEGYIGPRTENGAAPEVVGWVSSSGSFVSREIRQVYATGLAASRITTPDTCDTTSTLPAAPTDGSPDRCAAFRKPSKELRGDDAGSRLMFAGTGTSVGVRVGIAQSSPSFHFGYRRKEMSIIPLGSEVSGGITTRVYPSVIAMFSNETKPGDTPGKSNFGVSQFFATGVAADNLATDRAIRNHFRNTASDAVAEFKEADRAQMNVALALIRCFTKVADAKLMDVWASARGLMIPDAKTAAALTKEPDLGKARALYVDRVAVVDSDNGAYGIRLEQHRAKVCQLRES